MPTPLCKVCGKPVPKETTRVSFGCRVDDRRSTWISLTAKPASLEEAQRLVNGRILHVDRQGYSPDSPDAIPKGGITGVTAWDGESYAWGGHFHAQGCAAQFGWAMANQFPDHAMPAYREAMAKRAKEGATNG